MRKTLAVSAALASLVMTAAACGNSKASGASSGSGSSANWGSARSAAAGGGMSALEAAARSEGTLNVITLPRDWANYGTIMDDFTKKYGIKINSENPDGSSQDEINAMTQLKGQSRDPDVLDMGTPFAIKADTSGLLAPYQVATYSQIPSSAKASDSTWYGDYGGYVAIGYDSNKVKDPPTSFADLKKPEYKNMIALNGNPTQAGAAFAGVFAAALANGGSYDNIQPGVTYFSNLHKEGNFVPVTGGPSTVQSGQTPIMIWWDYLLASEVQSVVPSFKIVIPSDANYASYYDQAINKAAPHPAAARLWEEYLYSTVGQNLWLQGKARPIELSNLVTAGTVDNAAYQALPAAPAGGVSFPSSDQVNKAETVVAQQWSAAIGS